MHSLSDRDDAFHTASRDRIQKKMEHRKSNNSNIKSLTTFAAAHKATGSNICWTIRGINKNHRRKTALGTCRLPWNGAAGQIRVLCRPRRTFMLCCCCYVEVTADRTDFCDHVYAHTMADLCMFRMSYSPRQEFIKLLQRLCRYRMVVLAFACKPATGSGSGSSAIHQRRRCKIS